MLNLSKERQAAGYMTGAHIGALSLVGYLALRFTHGPDFAIGVTVGIMLVSVCALVWGSRTDEYLKALWSAGATSAFLFTVVAFLFGPVLFGQQGFFIDGTSPPVSQVHFLGMLAILAFYAGFHIQWLRSRA